MSPTPHSWNPSFPVIPNCSWTLYFAREKVEKFLEAIDSDSATGPDGISSRVRKTCSAALADPLSALFTLSFARCHLPSAWKYANIKVLHKKGAKTDPLNYKPISLPPIISKIMESIITGDRKTFLSSSNLISDHQFGFRPDHSTLDMLDAAYALTTMDESPQYQT